MNAGWQGWLYRLIVGSALTALAKETIPAGGCRRVAEFVCGVMLLALLLEPLAQADRDAFSAALSDYRRTAAELTDDVERQEKALERSFIEDRFEAYILSRAESLGIKTIDISVSVKWRDENWIPFGVDIRAEATDEQKRQLSGFLDSELGIPVSRQRWGE